MGLLSALPFLHRLPGIPLFSFNAQKGSLQKLVGSAQLLFHLHPVAVVGGLIGQGNHRGLLVHIFKGKLPGRQGEHVVRGRLGLLTHVGVGLKAPVPVQVSDGHRVKDSFSIRICHRLLALDSQSLIRKGKLRPRKFYFRVVRIALYHRQDPLRDFVNHLCLLDDLRIRHRERNVHGLQKSVGCGLLPEDIVPHRDVLHQMGLQVPHCEALRYPSGRRVFLGVHPVLAADPPGRHILVLAILRRLVQHQGFLTHLTGFLIHRVNGEHRPLDLLPAGDSYLVHGQPQGFLRHIGKVYGFQMPRIFDGNEHGLCRGIARRGAGFHQHVVSHRKVFHADSSSFRIVPAALECIGDGLVLVVILDDWIVPSRVRRYPAGGCHLLAVLIGGCPEGENPVLLII